MAISVAIEWDVQSGGSDSNGGGFKAGATGVDYSQSTAPHATLTTASVVGASTSDIVVSALDYTVSTNDVGNVVQIATVAGAGAINFYEIQSVNTGTNTWTVDRAVGTTGQTVTGLMGGCLATPNKIMSEATTLVAGQTIHIKNTTYTRTATITLAVSGTAAAGSINVIGYNSTHNDITTWAGMANAPILTSATNSVHIITMNGKTLWKFKALKLTSTAATRGASISMGSVIVITDLCYMEALNGVVGTGSPTLRMTRTEIKDCTSHGLTGISNGYFDYCWIHGSALSGINMASAGGFTLLNCVVDHNNTGNIANTPGIKGTSPAFIFIQNSVVAYNTGSNTDGIQWVTAGPSGDYVIMNSIFYANGRYNLNTPTVGAYTLKEYNAWGGAGTANFNGVDTVGGNAIALAATPGGDPFVSSAANGNFGLNTTGGAGALLRALGFPGGFPGGSMTGYLDVGAIQHQDSGGSSGTPSWAGS